MTEFVPSPHLNVCRTNGRFRLTKNEPHEDYSVWEGGKIICQGGRILATQTFERKTKMTEQAVTPKVMTIDDRVAQYIKLRDMIKDKDDKHKDMMAPYREALEKLNSVLLMQLDKVGGDSVKTSHGTVYKTVKKSASLEDADQFMRHVIGTESWELLERKCSIKAVEAFLEENKVLPPGVKMSSTQVVGVRRA